MRAFELRSGDKAVRRAREFLAKGDIQHAVLDARRALELDPKDAEANRIIAQALESASAPEAQEWRRRLGSILPDDAENLIAWAKDVQMGGYPETAAELLGRVRPGDRTGVQYHDVAARIAMVKGDAAGAESHWAEAARLDPKAERYRVNLAILRRKFGDGKAREEALGALRELSGTQESGPAAQRALLADAIMHGDAEGVKKAAEALASAPGAAFRDRLERLAALRALKDPDFSRLLGELRDGAAGKPTELYELLSWMNRHSLSLLVLDWLPEFPPDVIRSPPVCIAVAGARENAAEWKKLKDGTEGGTWDAFDFARIAYKARALERLGDADGSEKAWEGALKAALGSPQRIQELAKLAFSWRWDQRGAEALWKVTASGTAPRWVLDALWTEALGRGDTEKLRQVSKLRMSASPRDIEARNNYVCLSLLRPVREDRVYQIAESLYEEAPGDPQVISTYAFSLFERGRAEGAVSAMKTLKPEQLREPGVARYHGILLAGSGRYAEAVEYLEIGEQGVMLPEERVLLDTAKATVRSRLQKPDGK